MNGDMPDLDIESQYQSYSRELTTTARNQELQVMSWLSSGREGSQVMSSIISYLSACELVVRFLTAQAVYQCTPSSSFLSLPLSIEHVEKSIQFISQLIAINFGSDDNINKARAPCAVVPSSTPTSPMRAKKPKKKTNVDEDNDLDGDYDDIEDEYVDSPPGPFKMTSTASTIGANASSGKGRKMKLKPETRRLLIELV